MEMWEREQKWKWKWKRRKQNGGTAILRGCVFLVGRGDGEGEGKVRKRGEGARGSQPERRKGWTTAQSGGDIDRGVR